MTSFQIQIPNMFSCRYTADGYRVQEACARSLFATDVALLALCFWVLHSLFDVALLLYTKTSVKLWGRVPDK